MLTRAIIVASLWMVPFVILGQKGPGGVSIESGSQSTCRIWLDASTLTTLADGDDLVEWPDVSPSEEDDDATPLNSGLPPYFRDDAANTINGYPVVTFEDGRFLLMESTSDLNLVDITHTKSAFFAFRSSSDITSKQVLYEEGGCWRGFNIHIQDGKIFIGAYDFNDDGIDNNGTYTDDGDGTDQWGYSYVSKPIDANTTYILSAQFYAKNEGVVNNNDDYYIKGWLNGQSMGALQLDFDYSDLVVSPNLGVGTLGLHDNPIGLGAVNDDFVDQHNEYCNNTGDFTFQGRLAEFIYYNDLLSQTERIIIENYLGAKYFASLLAVNDKYDHQAYYGKEVIGIGQETNAADNNHNLSQGRNPFQISEVTTNPFANNHYFLTGHNGGNMLLTNNNVPNESESIERLERIWRVDETGTFGQVSVEIDEADIPAKPSPEFSKLVLLVDETSSNFPNFSLASTRVKEIPLQSGTLHQIGYDFPDNAFFTFAWLKPEVGFLLSEASGLEADPTPDAVTEYSATVKLNYDPLFNASNTVDYILVDAGQSAEPADYGYDSGEQAGGLEIPISQPSAPLTFDIVNDDVADNESTEKFLIILQQGSNTTSGLSIGERDTLVFSILDDDPPPTGGFLSTSDNVSESAGYYYVKFQRTGDPTEMNATSSEIRIRRKANPNEGTANYNSDYNLATVDGWSGSVASRKHDYTFPAANVSSQLDSVRVNVINDNINEYDETVNLTLEGLNGFAIDATSIIDFQLTIVEDDPLPKANFLIDNQTGYESVGDPAIAIQLDRPSTRPVKVFYNIDTGAGSTTYESDFTGTGVSENGSVQIPAEDSIAYLGPFNVNADGVVDEAPETVVFNLVSAEFATIGSIYPQHTYTILDYTPFEWKGAAGVGKNSDNIVWLDANRMGPLGMKSSINNFSPRDINIEHADGNNTEAELINNGINTRQTVQFDGIDDGSNGDFYSIDENSFINLAGSMQRKNFFFALRPTDVPDVSVSNPNLTPSANEVRMIYEQGGSWRGLTIYLYNKHLYFHIWNGRNDGPESYWGYLYNGSGNSATKIERAVYARSSQEILAGEDYIISCQYDNNSDEPIMVWVNGKKGIMSSTIQAAPQESVGRLYTHSSVNLGGVLRGGRVHFTTKDMVDNKCCFEGMISEFIMFHEPLMSEARRVIIENYLSAKFNIPLDDSDTRQIFDPVFADMTSDPANDFNNEVAGVGQIINGSDTLYHGDAQGPAILRGKAPIFSANTGFLAWGHNGQSLTNTWPYSYWNANLPEGIQERSGKVWKVFEKPNGSVSSADFFINFSSSDNAIPLSTNNTMLKLLVHPGSDTDPQDFSNATVVDAEAINNGYVAYFKDVLVTDGMYIALANTSPINISPLPIELLSFNAKFQVDHVNLIWATASEIDNDYFEIQRADADLKWDKITRVPGAGNSNTTIYYNEKDRDPLTGISYYRLKQVDFDGNFEYSDVVSVVNTIENGSDEVFIYPNPVRGGSIVIRIPYAFSKSNTHVSIYDLSGKILLTSALENGELLSQVNIEKLKPGAYLVHIHSALLDETKKLIVN